MPLPNPKLLAGSLQIQLHHYRQAALTFWHQIRQKTTRKRVLLAVGGSLGTVVLALAVAFLWPRTVQFAYADSNCFTNPTLLPGLMQQTHQPTFRAAQRSAVSIAGHALYSHTTCITPVHGPRPHTTERITLKPLGAPFIHRTIRVVAGSPPSVSLVAEQLAKALPTNRPLAFKLSTSDRVFAYQIWADNKTAPCTKSEAQLSCNLPALHLAQSANYNLSVQRVFAGHAQDAVFKRAVTTVDAVQLTNSSIAAGQTVYDAPTHLTLTFNKPIDAYDGATLYMIAEDGTLQRIVTTITPQGFVLDFAFDEALPRSAKFEAHVDTILAPDGGHLPEPLVMPFSTSGGPKVQHVSIGSSRVATGDNISLTFDTAVSATQNLSDFIQVQINGAAASATLTRSGNKVSINPTDALPQCAKFTVKVLDGLQNEGGISGNSAWAYNSRALCYSTFSIGTSVNGRSITAYAFGTGGSTVVYAGNIHGNEKSAQATLTSWIDYLERNYDSIPAGRTIVVIPTLNPDGYAANSRTNAHNVDLNRNFSTANWKQSVTMPGGALNSNGGGSAPLSEPESAAFAKYIASTHPRLVLTYHSTAGIVQPNDAGDSVALAKTYDQKSNLNYSPSSDSSTVFEYDTTGSFEDWAYQTHNAPVLLIELWTKTSNEFAKNQNAMWHMVTL